ncbi:hypothetical protein ES319_D06G049200v1 [Gossypium barbadense]|uniref:Uncharacterized protein n=2 Tax=Gossypium TaxID=3633 RepID=A0A5J5QXW5_GOSBA|nr:hypothetical protein ES319_D06G049200v1 [Gossypium barbadense]TYG63733.1 hypothetical protein ES288_D06G053400v1 [Gossypium darwinii]
MEMNNFENLNRRRQLILVEPFVECFCNLRLTFKRYEEYWGDPVTKTLHSSDMRFLLYTILNCCRSYFEIR